MSIGKYLFRTVDILAILFTIGYFSVLGIAFFKSFPESNRDVLNILFGILSMVMVKIIEAYFIKDAANSATATTIRAMKAEANEEIRA